MFYILSHILHLHVDSTIADVYRAIHVAAVTHGFGPCDQGVLKAYPNPYIHGIKN